MRGLIPLIYLILGVVVALQNDFFQNMNTLSEVLSAVLAILLWPLVLLGVDLHIR